MMGQYYLVANVDKQEYMQGNGFVKLMEWSYNRNPIVLSLEELMDNEWKGDRIYVIGDYADSESALCHSDLIRDLEKEFGCNSLYSHIQSRFKRLNYAEDISVDFRYIFNHNQKCFVDMEHCPLDIHLGVFQNRGKWYHATIAPLPLLLALGNGLGGGDYRGNNDHQVGEWAKDSDKIEICEEMKYPEYKEYQPEFYEDQLVPYTEKEKRIEMKRYHRTKDTLRSR